VGRNLTNLLERTDEAFITGDESGQEKCLALLDMKMSSWYDDDFHKDQAEARKRPEKIDQNQEMYAAYHRLMARRRMWGTKTIGDRV
jgi:hypothetical protein